MLQTGAAAVVLVLCMGICFLGEALAACGAQKAQATAGNSCKLNHDGAGKTQVFPKYSGERWREKLGLVGQEGGLVPERWACSVESKEKRRLGGSENIK